MIAVAYAVPLGVVAGWSGVLDMILTPAKVSQVRHSHGCPEHASQARSAVQLRVHVHAHTHIHQRMHAGLLAHGLTDSRTH